MGDIIRAMSKAQVLGNKRRWRKVSKKERSRIMRAVAKAKWSKISLKKRRAHSKLMNAHKTNAQTVTSTEGKNR